VPRIFSKIYLGNVPGFVYSFFTMNAKPTLATLKSFIRKNRAALQILVGSRFDGMSDCVESTGNKNFTPALSDDRGFSDHTLGIAGIWLVGSSRDYIRRFSENGFEGLEVSNCCGHFTVAIPIPGYKAPEPAPEPVKAAPVASQAMLAEASAVCGEEVAEILSGAESLDSFPTIEVAREVIPQGEAIPQAPGNIIQAFPSISENQSKAKLSAILATFETAQLIEELAARGNEGLLAIREYIMTQARL
jgi:hypothetical protein